VGAKLCEALELEAGECVGTAAQRRTHWRERILPPAACIGAMIFLGKLAHDAIILPFVIRTAPVRRYLSTRGTRCRQSHGRALAGHPQCRGAHPQLLRLGPRSLLDRPEGSSKLPAAGLPRSLRAWPARSLPEPTVVQKKWLSSSGSRRTARTADLPRPRAL